MNLALDEVHIWLTAKSDVPGSALAAYYELMNDAERARNKGLRTQSMRDADAVTRALQRTTLSQYERSCPPSQWGFAKEGHGKPVIASPQTSLCFNLSHSREWVACAVARSARVGVDVENCHRNSPIHTLAKRFFSDPEYRDLTRLPEAAQKGRFFDYWTLKEAYIKARGEGISLGLSKFSFDLNTAGTIGFSCHSELQDDPAQWRFMLSCKEGDHRLALAIKRREFVGEMRVRHFITTPLHSIEDYTGPLCLQPWKEARAAVVD